MSYTKSSATWVSIILLLAVLLPIGQHFQSDPEDSFPFSYYPMFSNRRGETYTVYYFAGFDEAGKRYPISYTLAGSGGFNQVRKQIRNAGRKKEIGKKLTTKIAKKVKKRDRRPYREMTEVKLLRGKFHIEDYFEKGQTDPVKEKVIARKKINR